MQRIKELSKLKIAGILYRLHEHFADFNGAAGYAKIGSSRLSFYIRKSSHYKVMLKIRLMRIGKRGQAYFRVVVQEQRSKNKGKYLEDLGFWNPHQNIFNVREERAKHWLKSGAQPSDTVHNFLVDKGLIEGPKVKKVRPKKKEGEGKTVEAVPPAAPVAPAEAAPTS